MANSAIKSESSLSLSSSVKPSDDLSRGVPKDWKFWCIISSLLLSIFQTAVLFTSIGVVLPTITRSLQGNQFIWVGSAYALGSSAVIPLCGGLSQIIGRRPILLSALGLFALGSTICGAASSMIMLVIGRAIQGLGSGTISSSTYIVLSDLVTLRERGMFNGLMSLAWALGGGVGPVIGGLLAQSGNWRWLFYLNLPICAINAILVLLFLRLKTPPATLKEKLRKMDIIGNILIIVSTTIIVIGLTWGGVRYPWLSASVLLPIGFGLVGLVVFIIYEIYFCEPPIVPIVLRTNWTSASSYIQSFLNSVVLAMLGYWYPVFFEACKEKSPIEAGVDMFGLSYSTSLVSLVTGIAIKKTGRYVIPMGVGWMLTVIGAALLTTLRADSSIAEAVGFLVVIGTGAGIIYVSVIFPILASIPVTQTAPSTALNVFCRSFGSIWGVTTGGAILQNELMKKLPASFLTQFPKGMEIAFETIPIIPSLEQPLRDDVRNTFGIALNVIWQVVFGISIVGMLLNIGLKQFELHTIVDKDWGRKDLPDDHNRSGLVSPSTDSVISERED